MKKPSKLRDCLKIPDVFWVNSLLMFGLYFIVFIALALVLAFGIDYFPSFAKGPLEAMLALVRRINSIKALPAIIIAIPLIFGPVMSYLSRKSESLRDNLLVNSTFITFFAILIMYPGVSRDTAIYQIPGILGQGLTFRVDIFSYIMALTASILWFFVSIYAHDYMRIEKHRNRFYLWMSLTYGGILGTVMAGDMLTLFLFFEIMTFSSYLLVAHNQSKESMLAGNSYIFIGVAGGLSLLVGMMLLYANTGTLEFTQSAKAFSEMGGIRYLISFFVIAGFGIKAGMLPVHIWLPRAHPVAPTPASALLSGMLIKIGAYGVLRFVITFLMPNEYEISGYKDILWSASKNVGFALIWMGIITMTVGVFMALQQGNMKKMLAYHSISQMGYIIMGIGVSAYLGYKGAMGFSGGIYHMVNHALFKSLLFMVVGIVYLRTKELDMYKQGGLWRKMPFVAGLCLIAALGITGMPGFNGFASKSILHHAIVEAYEYGHSSFRYAEIIFTIVSGGTVCSFIKLFGFVFLGKLPDYHKDLKKKSGIAEYAMTGIALIIIMIGVFPNFAMDYLIIPATRALTFDSAFIDKYLVGMNFFNSKDLLTMLWVYLLGGAIFILGKRFHLFHLHFYERLDIERYVYKPIYRGIVSTSEGVSRRYERRFLDSDVVIYATMLTVGLFLLLRFVGI